jgi:hypothetical protein
MKESNMTTDTDTKTSGAMNSLADLIAHYANAWKGIVDTFTNVEKDKLKDLLGVYTQAELDYQSSVAKTPNDTPTLQAHVEIARQALLDVFDYLHTIKEPAKLETGTVETLPPPAASTLP